MKTATITINVTAYVNGNEVPCELAEGVKVIIDGNLTVRDVTLEVDKP